MSPRLGQIHSWASVLCLVIYADNFSLILLIMTRVKSVSIVNGLNLDVSLGYAFSVTLHTKQSLKERLFTCWHFDDQRGNNFFSSELSSLKMTLWPWRWLSFRLSKCQSQTTVNSEQCFMWRSHQITWTTNPHLPVYRQLLSSSISNMTYWVL